MAELPCILIVDDSRAVRAALIQHLKGSYRIREEADGEAAWQTLVLDSSIRAIISDLDMPKLGGFALLERMRESKLRRLQELPFVVLSGDETEDERARAQQAGVSDFVTKGVGSSEILVRLNHLLALAHARESLEAGQEERVQDATSGLFTRKYVEFQADQALSHAIRHAGEISVMVIGFDNFSGLGERLGEEHAAQAAQGFASLLAGKIRQEDSLGHFGAGQFAIVSPGTELAHYVSFAGRVRQAIERGKLSSHGQSIRLTASIGVAGFPVDRAVSGSALLELAGQRLQEALQAGGNRIVSGGIAAATRPMTVHYALEMLAADRAETVKPHLTALGTQLFPLLQLLNQELNLTLPLDEIEHALRERVVRQR